MKGLTGTFLKGLITLAPLIFSIYVLIWFLSLVEGMSRNMISVVWAEPFPGVGIAAMVVLVFFVGTVVDRPYARYAFNAIESLFKEVPIVKTVYLAIKDFTEFLRPSNGRKANQVVLVKFAESGIEMVGLLTRESLHDLPSAVSKTERVAVYFPMSYQFGGCTLFIPRAWVTPTDLSVEAAMRSIITAWVPGQDKKLEHV